MWFDISTMIFSVIFDRRQWEPKSQQRNWRQRAEKRGKKNSENNFEFRFFSSFVSSCFCFPLPDQKQSHKLDRNNMSELRVTFNWLTETFSATKLNSNFEKVSVRRRGLRIERRKTEMKNLFYSPLENSFSRQILMQMKTEKEKMEINWSEHSRLESVVVCRFTSRFKFSQTKKRKEATQKMTIIMPRNWPIDDSWFFNNDLLNSMSNRPFNAFRVNRC